MDHNRFSVTRYMKGEKTHSAMTIEKFRKIGYINDQLYEVELAKAEIEHKEPVSLSCFIMQYAKLRVLEIYYSFSRTFCDTDKCEDLEMDTKTL